MAWGLKNCAKTMRSTRYRGGQTERTIEPSEKKKCSCVVKIHCEVNSTLSSIMQIFIAHLHFTMITFMFERKRKGSRGRSSARKAQHNKRKAFVSRRRFGKRAGRKKARKAIFPFIRFIFMSFKWAIYCVRPIFILYA